MSGSKQVLVHELRPTQLTVGMIEVASKRRHLEALGPAPREEYLRAHAVPAVVGPGRHLYITDHHHLARAALEAGITTVWYENQKDLSHLGESAFWSEMDEQLWVHPLDEHGVRHLYSAIPAGLGALSDDVYRSLAGFVRDAGGFDKTPTAFAEFVWADFFRRSVAVESVRADFDAAVKLGMKLARSKQAKHLPGYRD
jgi:hypothetical protein